MLVKKKNSKESQSKTLGNAYQRHLVQNTLFMAPLSSLSNALTTSICLKNQPWTTWPWTSQRPRVRSGASTRLTKRWTAMQIQCLIMAAAPTRSMIRSAGSGSTYWSGTKCTPSESPTVGHIGVSHAR